MYFSPSSTLRMASSTISPISCFVTKPSAPARNVAGGKAPRSRKRRSAGAAGLDPLGGAMGQLGGGPDHQLLLEMLAVGFDRLDAQMEGLRDLAGAPALPDQAKHLQLAVAERLQGRVRGKRPPRHVSRGQPLLDGAAQVRLAGQQRSEEHTSELQSRQYLVCRLLLE